jgi:sec-independent protein translocase protein TatB
MFDIGWSELLVIAVVALVAIGPKELPTVLRTLGQWMTKLRRMASEFQNQFHEAMREAEMADLKKEVDNLNDAAKGFTSQFDDPLNLKEATKWEPKPDDAKPDETKAADAPQEPASASHDAAPPHVAHGGDEAFPVAAEHPAVAPTPVSPSTSSPAGAGANGGGAADTALAPPVTPPAAQPPLPEGKRSEEGGVHS